MGILDYLGGKYDEYKQSEMPLAYLLRGDYQGFPEAYKQNAINSSYGLLTDTMEGKNLPIGGILGKTKIASKTEMELANEIASKNAETMLGLPKGNTAMDRAKAMGFDVDNTYYHGTTKGTEEGIKKFDLSLAGKQTGNPNSALGVFTTQNPIEASRYTKDFGKQEYPAVYPLIIKTGKQYEMPYSEANNLAMQLFYNRENPKALALQKRNDLLNKGFNSIKVKINPDEFVSMNPSDIRSINAAFDPARANESDILAGMMAFPVSGLLQEPKKKKNK